MLRKLSIGLVTVLATTAFAQAGTKIETPLLGGFDDFAIGPEDGLVIHNPQYITNWAGVL